MRHHVRSMVSYCREHPLFAFAIHHVAIWNDGKDDSYKLRFSTFQNEHSFTISSKQTAVIHNSCSNSSAFISNISEIGSP